MIARTQHPVEGESLQNQLPSWQEELSRAIRQPRELLEALQLPAELLDGMNQGDQLFPLRVPYPYLSRIEPGNPQDPLLLQVLPSLQETRQVPGYLTDPLQEQQAIAHPGVLHKYHGRVLLIVSGACAINCRYCFRRHFPYDDNNLSTQEWEQALAYLAQDSSIDEVILSGGDPLAVNDKRLLWLINRLEAIPHLQRLRIHTRLPIVIPQRITPELLQGLQQSRLQKVMVVHVNHAQELDTPVRQALKQVQEAGVTLLNQAVLLRNVNDDTDTLTKLSKQLFSAGVLPYYLHLLDPVQGAAHFDVPHAEAVALVKSLLELLPGYLVPKLVREDPGHPSKSPLL